jgi:hypothetical protein
MRQKSILDESARHAIEETWAVLSEGETPNPALFLVRLADLARSNAFLWAETSLQVQERSPYGRFKLVKPYRAPWCWQPSPLISWLATPLCPSVRGGCPPSLPSLCRK